MRNVSEVTTEKFDGWDKYIVQTNYGRVTRFSKCSSIYIARQSAKQDRADGFVTEIFKNK